MSPKTVKKSRQFLFTFQPNGAELTSLWRDFLKKIFRKVAHPSKTHLLTKQKTLSVITSVQPNSRFMATFPFADFYDFHVPSFIRCANHCSFSKVGTCRHFIQPKTYLTRNERKAHLITSSKTLSIFYLVERVVIIPGHLTFSSSTWLRLRLSFLPG